MAQPDNSINPRIIESAKKEFLKHGFKAASLRTICENAGVTTGALYKRYAGKEELFYAVVKPTLDDFESLGKSVQQYNYENLNNHSFQKVWDMSEETHKNWIKFFYARYDEMKILLCCSKDTKYSNFLNDFVNKNAKQTMEFICEVKRQGIKVNDIQEDELHIFLTAYWTAVFEIIIHDFPIEKALNYCSIFSKFFNWQAVFGF